jgi:BASS family bile acid:Na+ symporter
VPGKELKIGGDKTYAYSLYTSMVLLSVVIVPVTIGVLANFYGGDVALGPMAVAGNVAMGVVLPLLAGVVFHRFAPATAERLSPLVRKFAMILLAVVVIPLLVISWPAIQSLIGNGTIIAMALTSAIALAAGHLLGGPTAGNRGALALAAATRHPGMALMIGKAVEDDKRVIAAILTFMLVGIIVSIPYEMWLKRRAGGTRAVSHGAGAAPRAQ